jgi:hypothetical protein
MGGFFIDNLAERTIVILAFKALLHIEKDQFMSNFMSKNIAFLELPLVELAKA